MQDKAYKDDYQAQKEDEITRRPACKISDDQKEGAGHNQRHSYELFPTAHSSSGVISL